MISLRSRVVYGMLGAIWLVLIGWQVQEHLRVRDEKRRELSDRLAERCDSVGRFMRSRRFPSVITRELLESSLGEFFLVGDLRSVLLVNADGETVASAGPPIDVPPMEELRGGAHWGDQYVVFFKPVDLGTNMAATNTVPIVMPREEISTLRSNFPPPPPDSSNAPPLADRRGPDSGSPPPPPPGDRFGQRFEGGPPPGDRPPGDTNDPLRRRRPRFDVRTLMNEEQYQALVHKKGVHGFILAMSTESVQSAASTDLWLRMVIALLGTMAVAGFGLAWFNLLQSSDLQIRLVRASELNLRLKEMNLAAAGLAHETRNPLSIIRGLAQIISRQDNASDEIRAKSRDIIDETDRVTAQLNEFINYSRPREVRRAPTDLTAVVAEVARALNYDIEEKHIHLQTIVEPIKIEADEQLLRQALFNLVLNAVQAVPDKGEIRIHASRRNHDHAFIEISDNGPGVSPENRAEIFKPYFTTHQEGTGLGLAVVQQIILAHGWEIECLSNQPAGALFRISHIRLDGRH